MALKVKYAARRGRCRFNKVIQACVILEEGAVNFLRPATRVLQWDVTFPSSREAMSAQVFDPDGK